MILQMEHDVKFPFLNNVIWTLFFFWFVVLFVGDKVSDTNL